MTMDQLKLKMQLLRCSTFCDSLYLTMIKGCSYEPKTKDVVVNLYELQHSSNMGQYAIAQTKGSVLYTKYLSAELAVYIKIGEQIMLCT